MKRNLLLLTCAISAVLVGIFCFRTPPAAVVQVPIYLDRAGSEAQLPPDSRNEILRRVQYAADGFTRQRLAVYFTNGDTGVTVFYPDGSLDVYRYHPTAREIDWRATTLSDKNLKVLLRIASDGKSVREERRWDVDGNLTRVGLRIPAGGFQVQGFYSDGKTAENSLFTSNGVLESQSTFWQNGNAKIVLKQPNSSSKEWSSFAENGKKIAWHKVDGNNESGEFFFEDGVTVRMKFAKEWTWAYYSGSSSVTATYYERDGSLTQTRVYNRSTFTVSIVKNGNTPAFTQSWKIIDSKRTMPAVLAADNVVLESIAVDRFDGLENAEIAVKDGKVTTVRGDRRLETGGVENVLRTYRADGTLEKEQVRLTTNPTERNFPDDSGGRIVLPNVFLAAPPNEAPPAFPAESVWAGGY